MVPLTVVGSDKTGQSDFRSFEQELPVPIHFMWQQSEALLYI
jgi:hypothetical protein